MKPLTSPSENVSPHISPPAVRERFGFSLVEVLIVIVILAALAAAIVPAFAEHATDAAVTATITNVNTIHRAASLVHAKTGEWPRDGIGNRFPEDFTGYLDPVVFKNPTPIGGRYDWNGEAKWGGVYAGISICHTGSSPLPRSTWREIDRRIDDGNLKSGRVYIYKGRFLQFEFVPDE